MEIIKVRDESGLKMVEFRWLGDEYTLMRWSKNYEERVWAITKGWNHPPRPEEVTKWEIEETPTPVSIGILQGYFVRWLWGELQPLIEAAA